MALKKAIELENGVTANYHKIRNVFISYHDKNCSVVLNSFLDETTRNNDKKPLKAYSYNFNGTEFDFHYDDNIFEKAYNKLKILPYH